MNRHDDPILCVSPGVCPPQPMYGLRFLNHVCGGRFSLLNFTAEFTREQLDPMALGTCCFCGEILPERAAA